MESELNGLSEALLLSVKKEQPVDELVAQLEAAPFERLVSELDSDQRKIAFWVNCYNAYFQILRTVQGLEKPQIYRSKKINIAGRQFSLDGIEHGILRRYRLKHSKGYLPNPFASSLIKQLAVSKIDWRIHFALNCGAQSCPPIAFYKVDPLDQMLDMATLAYLTTETEVDDEKKEIRVTQLFRWFAGDFGGKSGIRKLLGDRLKIETAGYQLVYKPWSWDEQLGHYAT